MKNITIIFLLTLLVSIQTPMGQFFKMPFLVEHFIKHQQQSGVSILGFLAEHYAADHNDADLPEDEKLPFKNNTLSGIGYAIVTPQLQSNEFIPMPIDKKIVSTYTCTPQVHVAGIFHPPRV